MIKGSKHTPEAKLKSKLAKLGKPRSGNPQNWKISEEIKQKISKTLTGKPRPYQIGNKNPNWKGGVSPQDKVIRGTLEYRLWRISVFERDNYTCVWCHKRGGKLHADHIKPFALYPELRFAIDNGRTLCVPCHQTTDTYAGRTLRFKK